MLTYVRDASGRLCLTAVSLGKCCSAVFLSLCSTSRGYGQHEVGVSPYVHACHVCLARFVLLVVREVLQSPLICASPVLVLFEMNQIGQPGLCGYNNTGRVIS